MRASEKTIRGKLPAFSERMNLEVTTKGNIIGNIVIRWTITLSSNGVLGSTRGTTVKEIDLETDKNNMTSIQSEAWTKYWSALRQEWLHKAWAGQNTAEERMFEVDTEGWAGIWPGEEAGEIPEDALPFSLTYLGGKCTMHGQDRQVVQAELYAGLCCVGIRAIGGCQQV